MGFGFNDRALSLMEPLIQPLMEPLIYSRHRQIFDPALILTLRLNSSG
jgi:hypothetical protein